MCMSSITFQNSLKFSFTVHHNVGLMLESPLLRKPSYFFGCSRNQCHGLTPVRWSTTIVQANLQWVMLLLKTNYYDPAWYSEAVIRNMQVHDDFKIKISIPATLLLGYLPDQTFFTVHKWSAVFHGKQTIYISTYVQAIIIICTIWWKWGKKNELKAHCLVMVRLDNVLANGQPRIREQEGLSLKQA